VLGKLHDGLYLGRTMAFYGKQQEVIQALQPAAINGVIKKYFKSADLYRVTGGDRNKAGGGASGAR
jgi:predicted Zn-dependent peptidase